MSAALCRRCASAQQPQLFLDGAVIIRLGRLFCRGSGPHQVWRQQAGSATVSLQQRVQVRRRFIGLIIYVGSILSTLVPTACAQLVVLLTRRPSAVMPFALVCVPKFVQPFCCLVTISQSHVLPAREAVDHIKHGDSRLAVPQSAFSKGYR
jgi:hypothetical protein